MLSQVPVDRLDHYLVDGGFRPIGSHDPVREGAFDLGRELRPNQALCFIAAPQPPRESDALLLLPASDHPNTLEQRVQARLDEKWNLGGGGILRRQLPQNAGVSQGVHAPPQRCVDRDPSANRRAVDRARRAQHFGQSRLHLVRSEHASRDLVRRARGDALFGDVAKDRALTLRNPSGDGDPQTRRLRPAREDVSNLLLKRERGQTNAARPRSSSIGTPLLCFGLLRSLRLGLCRCHEFFRRFRGARFGLC